MAENENVLVPEETPVAPESPKPAKKQNKFAAGLKERFRKFIVNLKRRPMNIAFAMLIISSVVNLCLLGNYAQIGINTTYSGQWGGLCVFVNQLFCILALMLFLNSFPKRSKKPNIVQLVLLFVFLAVLMGLDLYLFIKWGAGYSADLANGDFFDRKEAFRKAFPAAYSGVLVHWILTAITTVLTATYPLYGKLIHQINTKKVVAETKLSEEIDTSAEV